MITKVVFAFMGFMAGFMAGFMVGFVPRSGERQECPIGRTTLVRG